MAVYDYIDDPAKAREARGGRFIKQGPQGFALHRGYPMDGGPDTFDLYEDDGMGNGDFIATFYTPERARWAAKALDEWQEASLKALDEDIKQRMWREGRSRV